MIRTRVVPPFTPVAGKPLLVPRNSKEPRPDLRKQLLQTTLPSFPELQDDPPSNQNHAFRSKSTKSQRTTTFITHVNNWQFDGMLNTDTREMIPTKLITMLQWIFSGVVTEHSSEVDL